MTGDGRDERTDRAHPGQHLPAPDHRGLRPVRGGAGGCPTCTTSASTGSTSRRCWRPSRAATTATTSSTTPRRRRPRRRRGPGGAVGRGAAPRAWACWSTSCPTTSASPTPAPNAVVVGRAAHGPGLARTPRAFDIDWDVGGGKVRHPGARRRRPATTARSTLRGASDGELRYYDHRFPLAPGTGDGGDDRDEVHARQHYELVDWRARRRRAELPPLLRGQHPGRRPRRGPGGVRRDSHARDPALVRRGRSSTGCGSTTPTACATRRATSTTWPTLTGGAYVLVEKILEPGEELPGVVGDRRHHRLRRAGAASTGCSTDPAGRGAARPRWRPGCAARPVDWHELIHDTQARGRRRHPAAPRCAGSPASVGDAARRRPPRDAGRRASPSCSPASRSTAPTCPRAASTSTQAFAPRARAPARTWPRRSTRSRPVLADPAPPAALRFQQTSGMVMAKGVEDCAFYRWSRLTSLNEVGGDPTRLRDRRRASSTRAMADAAGATGRTR